MYLESGSSGSKQENGIAAQAYDEVCISPKSPTYSKITVSDDAISIKAECIDDSGRLKCIDKFEINKYSGTYAAVKEAEYDIPERDFADVKPGDDCEDALTLLSSLGIVEKTPLFRPNEEISGADFALWLDRASGADEKPGDLGALAYEDAVRLILERLGYGEYIGLSGGDYAAVAKDIGLYKKTDRAVLTRAAAAQLIANALEAYIVELDGIDGEYANYHQVYDNWLGRVHNVYKVRGIIKDRPFYRSNSSDTSVLFETEYGENLTVGYSENTYSLLGYETDAYIRAPYDRGEMVCAFKTKNNNVLEIKKSWYGDVESVDKYINFAYTGNIGGKKKIRIAKDAEFVYNEARSESVRQKALSGEHNAFKPSHIGKVTLVDYNNDNVYDFIFIDNYKDMLVSGIDSGSCKITNGLKYQEGISVKKSKYNEIPSIKLDKNDANYRVTFSGAEEEGAAFSSITQNSVISVALSSTDDEAPEMARIRRVYVSNLSASGVVKSVFEDDGDDYFVIDGKAYRASKSYYNTYNSGNSVGFSTIGMGDCVSLYLDYDGRIAYLEKNVSEQTGLLLRVSTCEDTEDEYNLRFFNTRGETVNYKIKEKQYRKFGIENVSLPILAEYKINGEYVYNISFDMDRKEYGVFTCLKNSNRFGNYFYNDNTRMLLYDGAKNDANSLKPEYYYSVTHDYLKNKHSYSADIFRVEKDYLPGIIILYDDRRDIALDDSVMAVAKIRQVLDEDDEPVYCLTGYSDGREISLELLPGAQNVPGCGDVIQYTLKPDGKVKQLKVLCGYDTEDFEKNTFLDDTSYAKSNTVKSVNNGIITVSRQGSYANYYTDGNTVVYNIKASDGNDICVGSVEDITDGDRIFIILKEGTASEIFVLKNE